MAIFLQNNVGVKINSVDLSDHITSVTLTQNFDELEVTALGDSSHKFVKGLEASTLTLNFLNDFAAASVQATLQSAYGTTVTAVLIPVKGTAVSATNPLYTVSIIVNNLTPLNGAVGDISNSSMSFTCNSTVVQTTSGSF
ncbi:hypothetical protein UFOVP1142_10 [uncultured Caudovirales phage]|uniref:Uncharacterized protein n=1 Tax=uncultured Caudovirales phage TaxID=2100421 RepID=A0A6J5R389_9CAUD|nr:hypothetical protein UFOVP1142_10 [uncultured Caudovirales phage]